MYTYKFTFNNSKEYYFCTPQGTKCQSLKVTFMMANPTYKKKPHYTILLWLKINPHPSFFIKKIVRFFRYMLVYETWTPSVSCGFEYKTSR